MPIYSIWALGASNISIVGGNGSLSAGGNGDGSNLTGATITLNNSNWEQIFITDNETDFGDSDSNQRLSGAQTFDGVSYPNNRRVEAEYRIEVTDGTNTYTLIGFNINQQGSAFPAYGTVEGLSFIGNFPPIGVGLSVTAVGEGPRASTTSTTPSVTYAAPPCFTPGTRIKTPRGLGRVEDLQVGDWIETKDAGVLPIRWIGRRLLTRAEIEQRPEFAPIRISRGALGNNRPFRDIDVSPQHRFVLNNAMVSYHFGIESALVAAKHLINGSTIYQRTDATQAMYLHLLLDRHHIVWAEGAETETLQLSEDSLDGMPTLQQQEVYTLFPELAQTAWRQRAARSTLKAWEAELVI